MTQLEPFRGRPAKHLSGGMQQKLALCCTLIHDPKLILLDEPTTGVDPISRRDLWLMVNNLVEDTGLTVLLTTSYMDEAARCHRVALMDRGRIIALGRPDELLSGLKGKVISLEADGQERAMIKRLRQSPDIEVAYPMGRNIHAVLKDGDPQAIKDDLTSAGFTVTKIGPGQPSIEDLFLYKVSNLKEEAINETAFERFFRKDIGPKEVSDGPETKARPVLIEAKSLEKKFAEFTAVDKISFGIKRGEIFGFLGPNGAGKTTTIKMLCGLLKPTSGQGTVAGFDLSRQEAEIKKSIGYMSQRFSLYGDLTVGENIELYGSVYGVARQQLLGRRRLILEITDLAGREDSLTKDLPLGLKQRLALGCAIVHQPSCVFLDEPTSGVDPVARRKFWDTIFLLSRQMGVTILVSTHHLDEAEYCDRVLLIDRGTIRAAGSADELRAKVRDELGPLLEVSTPDLFAAYKKLKASFPGCQIYGSRLHVYTRDPERDRQKIREVLSADLPARPAVEVQERTMPFESVFTYFCETGKENG